VEPNITLLARLGKWQLQHRLIPILGRPLVFRVRETRVSGSNGEIDCLVVSLVCDDEGIYDGRDGQKDGEESEDGPGEEETRGTVGYVLSFTPP